MRYSLPSAACLLLLSVQLSGCGSSDSEETSYPDAYVQFYNGSPNSAVTYMRDDDGTSYSSASYGDSTSLYEVESGQMTLEFYRTDSDDQEVDIKTLDVDVSSSRKTLIVLSGDYEAADFAVHQFDREELEDHFRLFTLNLTESQQAYDLYMAENGEPFDAASFLGTLNYQAFDEQAYWDGDSDSDDFNQDEYTLYLTLPGSEEVVFESPAINFQYASEYVLVLRDSTGAIQGELEVDLILNSTAVSNYADNDATSQYRIYNSLDDDSGTMQVSMDGNEDTPIEIELEANQLSDFSKVDFGDYRLSAVHSADDTLTFNNRLVTLNQGQSKALILLTDENGLLTSMSFQESSLPQEYDKQVQVANLVPDYTDIDFYFVRKDETIDTAVYRVTSVDFAQSKSITLPSDFYELIAVYDDSDDTQVLLDRTELLGLNEDRNYIITVEPDASSVSGYSVSLLY